MKIILLKDAKKQGKSGGILEVKDGYGNFLISKGDAVVATKVSVNILDKENKEREANELLNIKKCEEEITLKGFKSNLNPSKIILSPIHSPSILYFILFFSR